MKTKTWIFLLAALLILSAGASAALLSPGEAAAFAEITSNGEIIKTVTLHMDQQFTIEAGGGYNTITITDGKIAVTGASCPDHYCMERGFCDRGTQIVCLPNRLVIRFLGEQPIDAVVG